MAIKLPSGFQVTAAEPIDERLVMSLGDMLAYPSARMPDHYFCICTGTNEIYIYDESRGTNPISGLFYPYSDYVNLMRKTESGYTATSVPNNGQVCFVDVGTELKMKVGNGTDTFADLPYMDFGAGSVSKAVIQGYYYAGNFYEDAAHTIICSPEVFKIYVDLTNIGTAGYNLFIYHNNVYQQVNVQSVPVATETQAGIVKLYTTQGTNEDGSITQKAVSAAINSITMSYDSTDSSLTLKPASWT